MRVFRSIRRMNQILEKNIIPHVPDPCSDARQEIKQRGALMQLHRVFARAAATVEEFNAVYLSVLIFFTVAHSSSSVPSETKKMEKYLHVSTCHGRGGLMRNRVFGQASPWHWL